MSGFSPEWLALRERADHRSRNPHLARKLERHLGGRQSIRVVDLGCGAGSNIRATSALLGRDQHWTLIDHDPRLLAVARTTLAAWADRAQPLEDGLVLEKAGRTLHVLSRQADLNSDLDGALAGSPDLVTTAALLDLCSQPFLERLVAALAERRAAFYAVLTYNGQQGWTPTHPADTAMTAAFHRHQTMDKGFGSAAGPGAPGVVASLLQDAGYAVEEGDSAWRLSSANGDGRLIADLAAGFAEAVAETGGVSEGTVADWRHVQRTGALVGHTDTFAVAPR